MAFEPDAPATGGRFVPDEPAPQAAPTKPAESPYSVRNLAGAGIEPLLALASGFVAAPVSGLAGMVGASLPGREGQGARVTERVGNALTYQPRTQGGKTALGAIAAPFEALAEGAHSAGGAVSDVAGPAAGAGVNAALQVVPQILLGRGLGKAAPIPGQMTAPPNVQAAVGRGLKLTPEEAGGGRISRFLSGLSGEPKLAKGISEKNQPAIRELVNEDVGAPRGAELTPDTLHAGRAQSGNAYEAARNLGRVTMDGQFTADLQRLVGDYAKAEVDFPGRKNTIMDMAQRLGVKDADASSIVSEINSLRKDSRRHRASGDYEASFAASDAAGALEQQLIRHAQASGAAPDVIQNMRAARTQIAKSHTAEKALKGDDKVDPQRYAKEKTKGRPLSGAGEELAGFAQDFPRSMQAPKGGASMGAPTIMDAAAGLLGGGPWWKQALMSMGRPGLRAGIASDMGQNLMLRPPNVGHAALRGMPIGAMQQGQLQQPPR